MMSTGDVASVELQSVNKGPLPEPRAPGGGWLVGGLPARWAPRVQGSWARFGTWSGRRSVIPPVDRCLRHTDPWGLPSEGCRVEGGLGAEPGAGEGVRSGQASGQHKTWHFSSVPSISLSWALQSLHVRSGLRGCGGGWVVCSDPWG